MARRSTNLSLPELAAEVENLKAMLAKVAARPTFPAAQATVRTIRQTGHGFTAKNPVRHNGTAWVKSQADTAANAVVGGIVLASLNADAFILATGGYVSGLSGLTAGSVHYLDAATAGALTTTAPTIAIPIIHADTATSGALLSFWAGGGGVANATDGGFVFASNSTTPFPGEWTKTLDLGTGQRTATATVGALDIAISTDGDAVLINDAADGIEIYDRSVSTTTPLIKISLGHASLNATGRQLAVREIDVCDAGVAKKMLVLASTPY
jgi:hypothetical protein